MDSRTLLSMIILGASLASAELIRMSSPSVGAVVLVLFGIFVSSVISTTTPLSIGLGALSAVAYVALRPHSALLAGAGFIVLVWSARSVRARGPAAVLLHGALAALGGVLATWLTMHFGAESWSKQAAAATVCALMLSLPLVIEVDAPRTAALLSLARKSRGPQRARLLRAAALSRRIEASSDASRSDRSLLHDVLGGVIRASERNARRASVELGLVLRQQLDAVALLLRALESRGDAHLGLETKSDKGLSEAREAVELEAKALRELAG
jgi:hypothetical protein